MKNAQTGTFYQKANANYATIPVLIVLKALQTAYIAKTKLLSNHLRQENAIVLIPKVSTTEGFVRLV